jgi:hypothetical protein
VERRPDTPPPRVDDLGKPLKISRPSLVECQLSKGSAGTVKHHVDTCVFKEPDLDLDVEVENCSRNSVLDSCVRATSCTTSRRF